MTAPQPAPAAADARGVVVDAAAVITGHCECGGPIVLDPTATQCRACWAGARLAEAEARGRAAALGPIVSPAMMLRVAKDEADAARIAYVDGAGSADDMAMMEGRVVFRGLLLLEAAERALAPAAKEADA